MKRLTVFLFTAILLTGSIYAQALSEQRAQEQQRKLPEQRMTEQPAQPRPQPAQNRQNREPRQIEINSVSVEGTLKLERGFAALQSGDTVYYVPMLTRFMGFLSELKEGAVVSVEGKGFRNFIQPEKVTVDGKTYDFAALRTPAFGQNFNPANQRQMRDIPKPNHPQMRQFPRNNRGENLRQNPPQMGKTPRFNQPNRNAPSPRNAPGKNNCNCNCESNSTQN